MCIMTELAISVTIKWESLGSKFLGRRHYSAPKFAPLVCADLDRRHMISGVIDKTRRHLFLPSEAAALQYLAV